MPPTSMTSCRRRVVIAEDHTIVREGLRALLSGCPDFEVVGEAGDGLEAVRLATRLQPDLVLIDLAMPRMTGLEAIREITSSCPRTRIVALTMRTDETAFLGAMRGGAKGYILKDTCCPDLLAALREVMLGKTYLSPQLPEALLEAYAAGKREGRTADETKGVWESLTARERQVLKMVAEGGTNRTIAAALCISAKTVDRHRTSVMSKLGLHSTSALTLYAVKQGLVQQD